MNITHERLAELTGISNKLEARARKAEANVARLEGRVATLEGDGKMTADKDEVIAHNYESISACMARIKELEAEYDELAMKSYRIPQKHHWRGECGHEWRIDQAGECPICERDRLAADCAVLRDVIGRAARSGQIPITWQDEFSNTLSDHPGDKLLVAIKAAGVLHNLVDELCAAVDAEGEDVGGHRGSLTILKEIGPADDELGQALDRLGDA